MEICPEKEEYESVDDIKRCKRIKYIGEWLVISGVFIETIVAGWLAWAEYANDPMRRPMAEMTAFAEVKLSKPATRPPYEIRSGFNTNFAHLSLGRIEKGMSFGSFLLEGQDFAKYEWDSGHPEYSMTFRRALGFRRLELKEDKPIGELEEYLNQATLQASFLPVDTEIEGGSLILTVNATVEYVFKIPKQTNHDVIVECAFVEMRRRK
jgi:hypothetical protein